MSERSGTITLAAREACWRDGVSPHVYFPWPLATGQGPSLYTHTSTSQGLRIQSGRGVWSIKRGDWRQEARRGRRPYPGGSGYVLTGGARKIRADSGVI